jgi:phage tail-like protein
MVINNVSRKAVLAFLLLALTLTIVTPAWADLTFGREKLKGTSKTMGDFNLSNRFNLEIDGISVAGVHTIEGIETESDIVEYKDGEDGVNRTRPGNHKPGKIVLTKDWSNTLEWYNWRKKVIDGKTDRRSVSIIFHDDVGTKVRRMNFYNCWPTKHTLPSFNAKKSGHATETIDLICESLELRGK